MKTMIQLAILAAVLAPLTTLAASHGARRATVPGRRVAPVPKPQPAPHPGRKIIPPAPRPPGKVVPPTPHPRHPHHHHHHYQHGYYPRVVYYPIGYVVRQAAPVVQTVPVVVTTPTARALTTREFQDSRAGCVGRQVTVFGRVTQAIRGAGGVDYYILDGTVRCELPRNISHALPRLAAVGQYVTIAGIVAAGDSTLASADLVACSHML